VTKTALLKKIETMLDDFERGRTWGTIEIQINEGTPHFVRKQTTEKLQETEPRGARFQHNGSR